MRFSRMTIIALIMAGGLSPVRGQQLATRDQPGAEHPDIHRLRETLANHGTEPTPCAELENGPAGSSPWFQFRYCELQELLASDGSGGDWFGYSVAIDGDVAVIGARLDDPNHPVWPFAGSAYVFRFNGTTWVEEAKLLASDPHNSAEFGWSVAISGDTIVVGTPQHVHTGIKSGSAYVFWYNGSSWIQQAELLASDRMPFDEFGCSVAIAGNHVLVGAGWDDNQNGNGAGAVYHFTRTGSSWAQTQKLLASDGQTDDKFGYSVAMHGNMLDGWKAAIGAPGDDDNGSSAGSAYVFCLGATGWSQDGKLLATGGASGDSFGWSVDIYGGRYYADVAVGAPYDDDPANGQNAGSAYLFYRPFIQGVPWQQLAKAVASDGAPWDYFGCCVAISSSLKVVIGACMDDDNGQDSGSAYVFWYDGSSWLEQSKLLPSDGTAGDHFGNAVAVSRRTALIGAHDHGCNGPSSGSAYIYTLCFGDLDGDGAVGLSDLAQLLSNYPTPSGAVYQDGDLDCDGDVDLADLAALLSVYRTTCP